MVDEDTGQLVADRLVHEQRSDGGVDAARQRAQHTLLPDLGADPLDLLLDHGRGRPGGPRAGDAVEEVLQHLLAVRRVHDLRVELDAVQVPVRRLEGGDRGRVGAGGHLGPVAVPQSRNRGGSSIPSGLPEDPGPALRASEARSCRTRPQRARRARRDPAPSAACRSRYRAPARRARRSPDRPAARCPRRPRPARRRGSARRGSSRAARPPRSGGRRAPSTPAPRGRGGRSAASTGRRGRRRARAPLLEPAEPPEPAPERGTAEPQRR